jgi:outer membrane protein assembly factor BamB
VCPPAWVGGPGLAVTTQPAVAGTGPTAVVFVGSWDGSVDAFPAAGCGAANCAPVWSADAGSPVIGAPAVSNGAVYVGTAAGLVAFGL